MKQHAADFGGDPNKILVMGISAGATHVADFVFRPELSPGAPAPAGAVLVSGVYTFDPESDASSAYYGNDPARRREATTLGHLTRTNVPVLITTAELDPPNLHRVALRLVQALTFEHDVLPALQATPGTQPLLAGPIDRDDRPDAFSGGAGSGRDHHRTVTRFAGRTFTARLDCAQRRCGGSEPMTREIT